MNNMVIVGQGAMGLLWYHHISKVRENNNIDYSQLHLVASNKPLTTKNTSYTDQYHFTNISDDHFQGVVNYAQTRDIQSADVIFLFLKSFQISAALSQISHLLKTDTVIVFAHNGMGTLTEIPQTIIQKHNIYALLTTHGCLRTAPLTITHTGIGVSDIGLLSGNINCDQQQALTLLLETALPCVTYHDNIVEKQWLKLAVNCVINPLTALNNINNGLVNNTHYQQSITKLLQEIVLVAQAEHIVLSSSTLANTVARVAQATAKNCSSMRCDVLAKRQTEIDYINGYIHRLGLKHGIATPENSKMWQLISQLTPQNI